MKKILWVVLILILLFVVFLWFGPKHDEQAQSERQNQSATETAVSSTDTGSSGTSLIAEATRENATSDAPVRLGAYAAIKNAWVTAPPPGSRVAAVYMSISNSGRAAAKVVSVASDDFEEMMFHRTVIEGGVASMQHVDYLEVPHGGSLVLEPNGMHIMAMEPERELKAGDQVSISFTFDDGQTYSATVPVR